MKHFKEQINSLLKNSFPALDVRTDQCDVVRIYLKNGMIGVTQKEESFVAEVIRPDNELDFDDYVDATFIATTIEDISSQILRFLEDEIGTDSTA